MVENREYGPSRDEVPASQNPSHKERVDEKMERQKSPENETHLTPAEHAAETQHNHDAQQAASQTSPTNPLTQTRDEERQKVEDEQMDPKAIEQHQQIDQNMEVETKQSSPGTDQDEQHYYGMSQ